MKRIFTIFVAILLMAGIFAQTPEKISYQAVVRNASNTLVTSHTVGMQISILQGSVSGTPVYVETQTPSTNANGLVSIEIGSGTVVSGNFDTIDWASGPYFIKIETDPTGGSNYTITGISQLLSVPYALYAKTAGNGFSGNYSDLTNKPNLTDTSKYLKSETDPIFKFSIANGIKSSDTTKWNAKSNFSGSYFDLLNRPTTTAGYGITDAVMTTGDQTITGVKTFSNGIVGSVNANNTVITNVAKPLANSDATTKAYVDSLYKRLLLTYADISTLLSTGYSIQEILDAGRSLQDLFKAGVNKDQLYGVKFKGGLIFYIDSITCTGLVCAENNLPDKAPWGCQGTVISGADGTAIGTGMQNTIDIVNGCSSVTAAKLCYNLVLNGFDDWFLPSKDESAAMFWNLYDKGKGNFKYEDYCWTSTEYSNGSDYGWNLVIFVFKQQGMSGNWKNENYGVRPVRAF